jgi:hypothetical protein
MAKNCTRGSDPTNPANGQQDISVQAALSLALGVSAFFGFCVIIFAHYLNFYGLMLINELGVTTEMEDSLRREEETDARC